MRWASHLPQEPASAVSLPIGWTWDKELSDLNSLLINQGFGEYQELD